MATRLPTEICDADYESYRREKYVKLLVCGKSGIGKSSLINSIVGKQVANVKDSGLEERFPSVKIKCRDTRSIREV